MTETLTNLGNLHLEQNRTDEARAVYDEAAAIYELFAARDLIDLPNLLSGPRL